YPSGGGVSTTTKVMVHIPCCGSLSQNPITLHAGTQTVAGRSDYSGFDWAVFTPAQPLLPNTAYTVDVQISYRPSFTGTFTTGAAADTTPPVLLSTVPANGSDTLALAQPIQMRFSKPINPLSIVQSSIQVQDAASGYSTANSAVDPADPTAIQITGSLVAGKVYRVFFKG